MSLRDQIEDQQNMTDADSCEGWYKIAPKVFNRLIAMINLLGIINEKHWSIFTTSETGVGLWWTYRCGDDTSSIDFDFEGDTVSLSFVTRSGNYSRTTTNSGEWIFDNFLDEAEKIREMVTNFQLEHLKMNVVFKGFSTQQAEEFAAWFKKMGENDCLPWMEEHANTKRVSTKKIEQVGNEIVVTVQAPEK